MEGSCAQINNINL